MKQLCLKSWGTRQWVEISISFVTDSEIKKYNFKYRKKNKPTDVLSFWNPNFKKDLKINGSQRPTFLGDIVISVDTTARNAKKLGKTFDDELKFLVIHGFLHCLGYDHEISQKEEKRMHKQERILWNYLK